MLVSASLQTLGIALTRWANTIGSACLDAMISPVHFAGNSDLGIDGVTEVRLGCMETFKRMVTCHGVYVARRWGWVRFLFSWITHKPSFKTVSSNTLPLGTLEAERKRGREGGREGRIECEEEPELGGKRLGKSYKERERVKGERDYLR